MINRSTLYCLLFAISLVFTLSSCSSSGDNNGTTPPLGKPRAPQNVTAIASGEGTITINWDQVAGATKYHVYMDSQANVTQESSGSEDYMVHENAPIPLIHPGLRFEQPYYFVVVAENSAGELSELSNEVTSIAKEFPPPTNVVATAGEYSVDISWDIAPGAESYNLYMAQESGITKDGNKSNDDTTTLIGFMTHEYAINPYPHTELTSDQAYYFAVEAIYPGGVTSRLSIEDTAIPLAPIPLPPSNLSVGVASSKKIPLSWVDNSNNEYGFRLERSEILADGSSSNWIIVSDNIDIDSTQYLEENTDTSVAFTPGTTYQYRLFAFTSAGDSPASNWLKVDTPPKDSGKLLAFSNTTAPNIKETDATAAAYYAAIDPLNQKTTLAAWKAANNFGTGYDIEADTPAVYLNDADLGFGRRMYMMTHADGSVASYVENYPSLDDALNSNNIMATVAMEFAPPTYKTPADEQLAASRQVVLAEDTDNELSNAHEVYDDVLQGHTYTIYVARENQESLGTFNLTITTEEKLINGATVTVIDSKTETIPGEWLTLAAGPDIKDPANPSFELVVPQPSGANSTTTVTLDMDATGDMNAIASSYVGMYYDNGTAVQPPPQTESRIETYLPAGTYTAVAATELIGAVGNFDVEVSIGNAAPQNYPGNWTGSGGATPNSDANQFIPFIVSAAAEPQKVSILLKVTEPTTIKPVLYLLGDIGDYRYVEAVNDEMEDAVAVGTPSYASITKTLAAGDYWVSAGTFNTPVAGYTGDYSLEIINNTTGVTIHSSMGSWVGSVEGNPLTTPNPETLLSLTDPSTSVTINLKLVDTTLVTPVDITLVTPIVYLLDSTKTSLLALNEGIFNNKSYIEMDLLPGDYKIVAASDGRNTAAKFQLEVTVNNDAPVQYVGAWTNSEEENPFSPSNPRFDLSLTKTSHVKIQLSSILDTSLFIIGRGDRKFTKFYTFAADGTRVGKVDLDGRGDKHQPGVCHVCHGGDPKALVAGVYPDYGDTGASFMAWDPDLYQYSNQSTYTRTEQAQKFMAFNKTVLNIRNVPHFDHEKSARTELIEGWYANSTEQTVAFNGDFVPQRWLPDLAGIPVGADKLYLDVIKPTCRLCHLQRGVSGEAAINFGSYADFMTFQKEIETTVYDAGTMPLALRTFNKFWQSGQGDILVDHLPGFSHYDGNTTKVLKPGRPIANAGASPRLENRKIEYAPTNPDPTPIVLNGSASVFAANYYWELDLTTNPPPLGSTDIQLTGANTATPTFIPDAAGDYTFILTVDDGTPITPRTSKSQITVSAIENPATISFSSDIIPKLDPSSGTYDMFVGPLGACTDCHSSLFYRLGKYGKFNKDIFLERRSQDFTAPDLYSQLLNKINLNDPTNSKIIAYPSSLKHGYGYIGKNATGKYVMTGYGQSITTQPANYAYYDIMLQWILEGAQNN